MDEIQSKEISRFKFLKRLYELSESQSSPFFDAAKIGKDIDLSGDTLRRVCDYLDAEGLIELVTENAQIVKITHFGIKEVEFVIRNPEAHSEHFPPWNVIVNTGIIQTQIVSGSGNTVSQTQFDARDELDYSELKDTLNRILIQLPDISNQVEAQNTIAAEVNSTLAQMESPRPDKPFIRAMLKRVEKALTAVGTQLAAEYAKKLLID